MQRTHPLTIFEKRYRRLFLLLVPLLRGFLYVLSDGNFLDWLSGVWMDLLVVLSILGWGTLTWRMQQYKITNCHLWAKSGPVMRKEQWIRLEESTVWLYQSILGRLTGVTRFRIGAPTGSWKHFEISFLLSKNSQPIDLLDCGGDVTAHYTVHKGCYIRWVLPFVVACGLLSAYLWVPFLSGLLLLGTVILFLRAVFVLYAAPRNEAVCYGHYWKFQYEGYFTLRTAYVPTAQIAFITVKYPFGTQKKSPSRVIFQGQGGAGFRYVLHCLQMRQNV